MATSTNMQLTWKPNKKAIAEHRDIIEAALLDGGEFIMEDANRHIPHDKGDMQRSGTVTQDGLEVALAYNTPYAPRQHEDTRLRHKPGREAKWLQRSFERNQRRVAQNIAERIRKAAP